MLIILPIMLIILPIMLCCTTQKSTYYAYINAQYLPTMLNNVLHLLYTMLNIPTLWIENE